VGSVLHHGRAGWLGDVDEHADHVGPQGQRESTQLDQLFSLKGTATDACSSSPALTLTINKVKFNF